MGKRSQLETIGTLREVLQLVKELHHEFFPFNIINYAVLENGFLRELPF